MKSIFISILCALVVSFPAFALKKSQPAPAFSLKAIQNYSTAKPLKLSDFRGKVVYVDFWASWCGPCRQSLPFLNDLRNTHKDKGFEVIAINLDEDTALAKKFLEKYSVDYPIVVDPSGKIAEKYELKGMPNAFLLDRKGNISDIHIGFKKKDKKKIEEKVVALLKAK